MGNSIYDVIIVGGGPAGLTAGIYAARARLKALLLEKKVLGGQVSVTEFIENYPGFPNGILGLELTQKMEEQARDFGLEITFSEAVSLSDEGYLKKVVADDAEYTSRAVIIATGAQPKTLDVPGEKEFLGRGVSYCATCDGPLFKGKKVLVVGGGDAAIEEALFLSKFAETVTVVHRREQLRATKILQERAFKESKMDFMLSARVIEIRGDSQVKSAIIRDQRGERNVHTDGVFIYIGAVPNTNFLKGTLNLDQKGYIITDNTLQTSVKGVFAAGDVRQNQLKQVAVAVGEGALAAVSAQRYIENGG